MKWCVLVMLVGCYRDAAAPATAPATRAAASTTTRTMAQLPVLDLRGADEYALFEHVRAVYAAGGFPDEAKAIELVVDDHVMLPYALQGNVVARHFLGDGPAPREHVAAISHWLFRDRLPADFAFADYRAFMTALVCNAFAHAIAIARGKASGGDPWAEQTRAIRFERGCLADLVRAKWAPADTLDAYARFDRVLLAAAAPHALEPAAFAEGWSDLVEAANRDPERPHGKPATVGLVLAMLAQYRDAQGGPASIGAVARELAK